MKWIKGLFKKKLKSGDSYNWVDTIKVSTSGDLILSGHERTGKKTVGFSKGSWRKFYVSSVLGNTKILVY